MLRAVRLPGSRSTGDGGLGSWNVKYHTGDGHVSGLPTRTVASLGLRCDLPRATTPARAPQRASRVRSGRAMARRSRGSPIAPEHPVGAPGEVSRWVCWISLMLDFVGFRVRTSRRRGQNWLRMLDFCWISRARNVCSHRRRRRKRALTRPSMFVKRRYRAASSPLPFDGRRGSRGGA